MTIDMGIDALQRDLLMHQGSRFEEPVNVKENGQIKDLTGWSARMQIRQYVESEDIIDEFSSSGGTPRILITPETGRVTVLVPGSVTKDYDFGDARYDLEIIDNGGEPITIMEGRIFLRREVTR